MSAPPNQAPLLTLPEQAVAAEVAYYQQGKALVPTPEDWSSWARPPAYAARWPRSGGLLAAYAPRSFARHVLERHGYSLLRYMVHHLSPPAWRVWVQAGSLVAPPGEGGTGEHRTDR